MSLPKIDLPRHEVKLTGINKKIKYRPFTVKEQKILLSAKAENNEAAYLEAIKQIIELCTFNKVDPNKLPIFDIETLFVKIRAKSVEEIVRIPYSYKYVDEEGKERKDKVTVEINLEDLEVKVPEDHDKKVMISDDLGIMMKYPGIEVMEGDMDEMKLILSCIDYIFDSEEVYYLKDESDDEVNEFFDSLDTATLRKINHFFNSMPRIRHTVEVELKDGTKESLTYKGINDFFT